MTDPNFQGIDPQQLGQMAQSLKNGVSNAQPLANYYQGRFSQLGLDTTAVSRLQQNYGWAQAQQPMLQRRYTLASHQPSGQFQNGMATAGAGTLQYATAQQAQAAGAKAAQQYLDGQISTAQYFALLQANGGDPDWQTGTVRTLGADRVLQLEQAATDTYPENTQGLKALAQAVAAAMANGVTFPYSSDPMDKGTENLDLLRPLLQYASFPASVLVTLGNEVTMGGPNSSSLYAAPVLKALAANPQAAAEFMAQFEQSHGASLGQYVAQGSDHQGMMPDDEAQLFANVIYAGTVGARNVDPKDAAFNVNSLASYYQANPDSHTYAEIEATYGKIISGSWPDVQASLTDPYYAGSPDGTNVSPDAWKAFIGEAMWDPKTAGNLLHFSAQQAAILASQNPDNPEAQHASGLINGIFDYEAESVYQKQLAAGQQNAQNWESQVKSQVTTVADYIVGFAFDPQGTLAGTAKTLVNDAVNTAIGLFPQITPSTTLKAPSVTSWQQEWQQAVSEAYMENSNVGNPQQYAKEFHCPPFLDSQGSLVANATAAQRQAYNAWLKDQAVAQAANQKFLNLEQGRIDGTTGGN